MPSVWSGTKLILRRTVSAHHDDVFTSRGDDRREAAGERRIGELLPGGEATDGGTVATVSADSTVVVCSVGGVVSAVVVVPTAVVDVVSVVEGRGTLEVGWGAGRRCCREWLIDPDVLHGDHAPASAVQPRLLREYRLQQTG